MRSASEHARLVQELVSDLATPERMPLAEALGRHLVQETRARCALPPFDNSQMDGYAVRAADLSDAPTTLRSTGIIPAGTQPEALLSGTTRAIMTGAPLPSGADAVVPVEKVHPPRFTTDGEVRFPEPVTPGAYVRARASDVCVDQVIAAAGALLTPPRLALLAATGHEIVPVWRRPRVLVLSTGSELRSPGETLEPSKIYDANTTLLTAALIDAGADVVAGHPVTDSPKEFLRSLQSQAEGFDLIVSSGGVSAGAREVVKEALSGTVEFAAVAIQPGGPQGLGRTFGVPFLAFPGNPVSAFISCEVFLRPAIRRIIGAPPHRTRATARLAEAVASPIDKLQLRRGALQPGGVVSLIGGAGSHLLGALADADALVELPVGVGRLPAGAGVTVWLLDPLRAEFAKPPPPPVAAPELSHVGAAGAARMVDVSAKAVTSRSATAQATVATRPDVVAALRRADLPKGDALGTARIAGIMAAKRTADLVPLCHPLPLSGVELDIDIDDAAVRITATVRTTAQTGVEMEALTAATIGAVTLYDMIKALDPAATIRSAVLHKAGGKGGEWNRDQ